MNDSEKLDAVRDLIQRFKDGGGGCGPMWKPCPLVEISKIIVVTKPRSDE